MSLVPPQTFRKTAGIHRVGLLAARPAAADVLTGTLYFATDTGALTRSDGTTWAAYAGTTVAAHHTTHETGGTDAITALSGSAITSGTVADARLSANVQLVSTLGVWAPYSVTWATTSGSVAIGNGTLVGRAMQLGKLQFYTITVTFGSTTAVSGAGVWSFSLPAPPAAAGRIPVGTCYSTDVGVNDYNGFVTIFGGATVFVSFASGNMTATVPFTWGPGDTFSLSGFYEVP